jgi:hydroxymethylglutaryl-CoA lyase
MAQGTDEGSPELDANRSPWEAMLPTSLELIEVGPRDGFQIIPDFIETADKITVIESLIGSGIRRMEVTSFVHPKAVPQMRDAAEVMRSIERNGCQCFAMTPNLKGAERAIEAGVDMLNLVVSASESHNRSNVRRSVDESLDGFPAVIELAEKAGTPTRASVSTVFGCPFEGNVPIERVMHVCRRLVDIGCVELNLCDTTGMAHPGQVAEVARAVLNEFDEIKVAMHFHNTRGAGAANMLAAIQVGIRAFESSFGGLGGCPFAPGAAGNVCTEDMVYMLHKMGIETEIDLSALIDVVRKAERILGITFPGQIIKAGQGCELHPIPAQKL